MIPIFISSYQFIRYPNSFSFSMKFCYFYSQRPSVLLNFRSSLPLQMSKEPGYPMVVLSEFPLLLYTKSIVFTHCRSGLPVQIPKKPSYRSRNSLLVSFYYFCSQRSSFLYSTVVHSSDIQSRRTRVVLAFCAGSVTFINMEHRLYSTIIHLYEFRYLRRCHTQAVLAFWSVSVTHIHKEHRFHLTVVHLYSFRYLRSRRIQAVSASS